MPDYNLLGSTEVLEELREGRTRELLMLLQDRPIPEVVDPLNIQSGISSEYNQTGSDYELAGESSSTATRLADDSSTDGYGNNRGLVINPNENLDSLEVVLSDNTSGIGDVEIAKNSDGTVLDTVDASGKSSGDTVSFSVSLLSGTKYRVQTDGTNSTIGYILNDPSYPYTSTLVDITGGLSGTSQDGSAYAFNDVKGIKNAATSGYITDRFAAPTTEPADFKAWNAIQARDVTTGESTSADPVEFEILDSTDTELNSSRIPKARIADQPFTMRNRVYSENAGSDGQSNYQIATTGDGGHYGIPVLTVVSVKKNGSVVDSANWSFDPDTDTVTIDTSSATIASGDTIAIKYDFDVFDSTLQPRAYLNRESTSETSPSISHFRYEYVI